MYIVLYLNLEIAMQYLEAEILDICYPDDFPGVNSMGIPCEYAVVAIPYEQLTTEELTERCLEHLRPLILFGYSVQDIVDSFKVNDLCTEEPTECFPDSWIYVLILEREF